MTRKRENNKQHQEKIWREEKGFLNQYFTFSRTRARTDSKAKKRGKPCERGLRRDGQEIQMIINETMRKTTVLIMLVTASPR